MYCNNFDQPKTLEDVLEGKAEHSGVGLTSVLILMLLMIQMSASGDGK